MVAATAPWHKTFSAQIEAELAKIGAQVGQLERAIGAPRRGRRCHSARPIAAIHLDSHSLHIVISARWEA
jgi:hypothetical protein